MASVSSLLRAPRRSELSPALRQRGHEQCPVGKALRARHPDAGVERAARSDRAARLGNGFTTGCQPTPKGSQRLRVALTPPIQQTLRSRDRAALPQPFLRASGSARSGPCRPAASPVSTIHRHLGLRSRTLASPPPMLKRRLFTPGPVPVPDRRSPGDGAPDHQPPTAADFLPVFQKCEQGLQRIFQTEEPVLIFAASGTGAMDAAVSNLLSPGDRALVVRGGKFGERWARDLPTPTASRPRASTSSGARPSIPPRSSAPSTTIPEIKAVYLQASETSTAVRHPVREIAEIGALVPRLVTVWWWSTPSPRSVSTTSRWTTGDSTS